MGYNPLIYKCIRITSIVKGKKAFLAEKGLN